MEAYFKKLKVTNKKILNSSKKMDELILKPYSFRKNNSYDKRVKMLINKWWYPNLGKIVKNIVAEKTTNKKSSIKEIYNQIIFGSHMVVMTHTMPIYFETPYHLKIYKLCEKIDKEIEKLENKEHILKINGLLYKKIYKINDKVFYKVENDRIKILYSKKSGEEKEKLLSSDKFLIDELNKKYSKII